MSYVTRKAAATWFSRRRKPATPPVPVMRRPMLAIEGVEPRLLMSGTSLSGALAAHVITTLHDNLASLATLMQDLQTQGALAHTMPLVSVSGSTTGGAIANFGNLFSNSVVAQITTTNLTPTDTGSLASQLATLITNAQGNFTSVSVVDHSTSNTVDLSFDLVSAQTQSFTFNFGSVGTTDGISIPGVTGSAAINTEFKFETTIDLTQITAGATPTVAQEEAAFAVHSDTLTVSIVANADLSNAAVQFGLLTLDVATPNGQTTPFAETAAFDIAIADFGGTALATAAAGSAAALLLGTTPDATVGIDASSTDGTGGTPLLDLPLTLTDANAIPGIAAFAAPADLVVTGHAAGISTGDDYVVDISAVTTALQTATNDPTFDPASLNTFSTAGLVASLDQISTYLNTLTQVPALALDIPFTHLTLGNLIDIATVFNNDVIAPLHHTVQELGFTEGQASATGQAVLTAASALSTADIANLPSQINIEITLANGVSSALSFAPTYTDANNIVHPVTTIDQLVTAMNQAISHSALEVSGTAEVVASESGGILALTASGQTGSNAAITVTSPTGVVGFTGVEQFGVQLARALGLAGASDASTPPATLLGELGLAYDGNTNAITFTIAKDFPLVASVTPFSLNLGGSVANLSITNGELSVGADVLLNLTVGLSLNPLGSDVNHPGGPAIGDGQNGTPNVTIGSLPVYVTASSGNTAVTADQVAGNGATGIADLQIIAASGVSHSFEITPTETLSNLETAISNAFNGAVVMTYNQAGHNELDITDNTTPFAGPAPSTVGIPTGAMAQSTTDSQNQPQAVLTGTVVNGADFSQPMEFLLTLGTMPPVVVQLPGGATNAASFAAEINTALGNISVADPTLLGLSASAQINYGQLVSASDVAGAINFTTTIYGALQTALGAAPQLSTQTLAAGFGIRIDPIGLSIAAINGSDLGNLFGLNGVAAPGSNQIIGAALDGETISDRILLENTGISATINAALVPQDSSQPVTVTGDLGPLGFTAALAPADVYVGIQASLLLNDSANAVPDVVTLNQLVSAVETGNFSNIWALALQDAPGNAHLAEINIASINLSAGSVSLTSAAAPGIDITLDNPSALISFSAPTVAVNVTGFDANLGLADIVSAIEQGLNAVDGGAMASPLPLVGVSIDQVLAFSTTLLTDLSNAAADPAGTVAILQTDLNSALGGQYITLSYDSVHDWLLIGLDYTASVTEQLPFNLNLSQLASSLGSNGAVLSALANLVSDVASLSASGQITLTASATLDLTLGINLGANSLPAQTASLLSSLNSQTGIGGLAAGTNDLQFNLGDGTQFQVNLGGLGANATVQDLLNTINTAAQTADNISNFATFDPTTGAITFNDTSSSAAAGLATLGFTPGQNATDSAGVAQLVGTVDLGSLDPTKAYNFMVDIGAGVSAEVQVAASASRTDAADLLHAIQAAIDTTLVSSSALLAENVPLQGQSTSVNQAISLGLLVTAGQNSGGDLVLSAPNAALGVDGSGHLINQLSLAAGAPVLSFSVQSINGSNVAKDLELGSNDASTSTTVSGARELSGSLLLPGSFGDRFFIDVGTNPSAPLTGAVVSFGLSATGLNFEAGIGPLSVNIVGGSATLGADLNGLAASNPNFAAGDPINNPGTIVVTLNDGFGGGVAGGGIVSFAAISHLGDAGYSLSSLVSFTSNVAVSINLPMEVLGQSVGAITVGISNLLGTANLAAQDVVVGPLPSLSNISVGSILNNPQTVIDGLNAFLSSLDGPLAQQLYSLDLPLVGEVFAPVGAFFSTLQSSVVGEMQSLLNQFEATHPGQPATTQNIVTQGLDYVLTSVMHAPGSVTSYIDSISNPTEIDFVWTFDVQLVNTTAALSANLGIPGLGLNLSNAGANLTINLIGNLGFGYTKAGGFFIFDTSNPAGVVYTSNNDPNNVTTVNFVTAHALDLAIAVTLPANFSASLTLGFLTASATNGTTMVAPDGAVGTSLTGDIFIDIGPQDTTGRLAFSQFSLQPILHVELQATVNVDLVLVAGFGTSGSANPELPTITTELLFGYSYDKVLMNATGNEPASGVTTPLTFSNVTLDVGQFLTGFLMPILNEVQQVIGPFEPFLNFIQQPIPGVSAILGPTSLLQLAQDLGGFNPDIAAVVRFIDVLNEVVSLVNSIEALPAGSDIMVNFGTYAFGHSSAAGATSLGSSSVDPFTTSLSGVNTSSFESAINTSGLANSLNAALGSLGGGISSSLNDLNGSGTQAPSAKGSLTLPILHDPLQLLEMLMGQLNPVDLVHFTLPPFNFTFTQTYTIPILGIPLFGLEAVISISVGLQINLAFGYDTTGIIEFTNDHNPLDFLNGFYVDDTLGPQITFNASISVSGELNLFLAKGGVTGELDGQVTFQLADPSGTGKVRADELLTELENDPLHIFNINGSLTVDVYLFYWVGIDLGVTEITLVSGTVNLLGPITLLSFSYDYASAHSTPQLASESSGGALALNLGANAARQENGGNINNPNQTYTITHNSGTAGNETVTVTDGNGNSQTYTGVNSITADLGTGNNNVTFAGGISSNVTLTGGDGNNVVDLSGVAGDPTVIFGNGNNVIYAASTETTYQAGNGNNTFYGGAAGNVVTLGNGQNLIVDGTGTSTVSAGNGNNVVYGGGGNDTIGVGTGNNTIFGGTGSDVITVTGVGNNVIFGHSGNTPSTTTGTTATATQISDTTITANAGNDTITGGGGNDIIFGGGGNNTITAGGGQSVVFGAIGSVTLDATGKLVSATDTATGGGNNLINGTSGSPIIIGGDGNNTISGGYGDAIILGGDGTVQGPSGGSNGQFSITGTDIGGTNVITGGLGNDVIIGGPGANTITGGAGNDIIAGHEAVVVRDSVYAAPNLISAQTTDNAGEPGVTITSGDSNDVILGGAGSNSIIAGQGADVILGHFGQVLATNAGQDLTITGMDAALNAGSNSVITANGSAVIVGGGGNNTITTYDTLSAGNPSLSLPAITSANWLELVFGASGTATVDRGSAGGFVFHTASTNEESVGGTNIITVVDGNDIIFGGAGGGTITAGNGNDTILGHLGEVVTATGIAPDVVARYVPEIGSTLGVSVPGLDQVQAMAGETIGAGNGQDVIMGGAGNNSITAGNGNDVVFGAAGQVTHSTTGALLSANTLEENLGGHETITLGLGANIIAAGAGGGIITAGNGDNIIFGHLGSVQTANGVQPNITGRVAPQYGNLLPATTAPFPNLGVAIAMNAATITAGDGNNVIMGGAGANSIVAGQGANIVFGAAGTVTQNTAGALVSTTTTEETLGGFDTITVGGGADIVMGGAGGASITAGGGNDVIMGHLGEVLAVNGTTPDVIGRVIPEIGANSSVATPGLNQPMNVTASTILVGDGQDVIMGGAGNNFISAGNGNDIVFGAAGAVTRDVVTHQLVLAQTIEETWGGNDVMAIGNGNDTVFGGPGSSNILVGNGNSTIFGHLGLARVATGHIANIVGRVIPQIGNLMPDVSGVFGGIGQPQATIGATIQAGDGNNVIIGGGGNNVISAGGGNNIVFGAAGEVEQTAVTLHLIRASTVEETLGGREIIQLGNGANNVFGGIGGGTITVGNGVDVVLGHLGQVDWITGTRNDVTGHAIPVVGAYGSNEVVPGLGVAETTVGVTITAGGGQDVIMGGAGNNSITTGNGEDVVFGASGGVTRNPNTLWLVGAQTLQNTIGGNDVITVGNGTDTVFGGPGNASFSVGTGKDAVITHIGVLPAGAVGAELHAMATAPQLAPVPAANAPDPLVNLTLNSVTGGTNGPSQAMLVLDPRSGTWLVDVVGGGNGPVLLLEGDTLPELVMEINPTPSSAYDIAAE